MEELVVPYDVFKQQGYEVTVASIKGGEIPVDEASLNPPFATKEVEEFILSGAGAFLHQPHHAAAGVCSTTCSWHAQDPSSGSATSRLRPPPPPPFVHVETAHCRCP